jgi:hypothetical protein
MPYGVPPKQFAMTFGLCFISMLSGQMLLMYAFLAPERVMESFDEESKAKTKAIKGVLLNN